MYKAGWKMIIVCDEGRASCGMRSGRCVKPLPAPLMKYQRDIVDRHWFRAIFLGLVSMGVQLLLATFFVTIIG